MVFGRVFRRASTEHQIITITVREFSARDMEHLLASIYVRNGRFTIREAKPYQ